MIDKHTPGDIQSIIINGYFWAIMMLIGILGWALKTIYNSVITNKFNEFEVRLKDMNSDLKRQIDETRRETRDEINAVRTQNEQMLAIMYDMRVDVAVALANKKDGD